MNDRSRGNIIRLAGAIAAAAAVFFLLAYDKNIFLLLLAAALAAYFIVSWLVHLVLKRQKRMSLAFAGAAVYAFNRLPPEEAQQAGGKGRVLAYLFQRGFPVPDGCILLAAAFDGDNLTEEAWQSVRTELARLRRGKQIPFAVRSSALCEDSEQASFAGEFETVLQVHSDEDIRQAIRQVRASGRSERVQSYTKARGLAGAEHSTAVIIQKLVQADISGVLFTADPLTGDLMHMTGNFVSGMGDRLVSGEVSASSFSFERPGGRYQGAAELQRVAHTLHREATAIEKEMGSPQDIEWATAGGRLYILQARPITTLNGYDPVHTVWNGSYRGNFLWSATNMMEAYPEVVTPFTASLRPYLDEIGGPGLSVRNYPLNGIVAGRFYANISVQVSAFAPMFGGDARRTYRQMSGWWGDIPDEIEDIPLLPLTGREWLCDMLPDIFRTIQQFGKYNKAVPQFLAENPAACETLLQKLEQASTPEELAALWHEDIGPRYCDSVYHIAAAASDAQVRLQQELEKLVGADDANVLLSNLGGLSGQLESLGPAAGLGMVLRGEMSRHDYLQRYGHRGDNEGEIAWPRPAEDPNWLEQQLQQYAAADVNVEELQARQQAAYEQAWQRFCEKYPRRQKSIQARLLKAAQAAHTREAVRSEATRGMTVVRAFTLRAAEMAGLGEDVFFITIRELQAELAGDQSARQHIAARRDMYRRYCELPPYPSFICGRFDPFDWAASENRRSDLYDAGHQTAPPPTEDGSIRGAPGALGVVEGTVRRLDSLDDSESFQKGEVLVTTMTNIGWTPLFPRAAAIVTDLGAPLSHAAIVAREMGIPAVVGCGNATARLKSGDRVRVDGGRGVVEIIE